MKRLKVDIAFRTFRMTCITIKGDLKEESDFMAAVNNTAVYKECLKWLIGTGFFSHVFMGSPFRG